MTIRRNQCEDLVSMICGDFSPYAACRIKQCLLSKHFSILMCFGTFYAGTVTRRG